MEENITLLEMIMFEELFNNKWISLRKIGNYVYSHETRCNGKIVSILPWREIYDDYGFLQNQFLMRLERTPCWTSSEPIRCTITGGVETDSPILDAQREILEETGYDVPESALEPLGTSYGTKSSDTIYYLYTVDLTDYEQGEAKGDGGFLESMEGCEWVNASAIIDCKDPQASVIWIRAFANHQGVE